MTDIADGSRLFWQLLGKKPPFLWGENEYALVSPIRLAKYIKQQCGKLDKDDKIEIEAILTKLRSLGKDILVDLECR